MGWAYLLQDLPCLCAVFRDGNLIAPTFQPTLQDLAEHRIVLRDQNSITCRSRLLQSKGWEFRGVAHGPPPGDPGRAGLPSGFSSGFQGTTPGKGISGWPGSNAGLGICPQRGCTKIRMKTTSMGACMPALCTVKKHPGEHYKDFFGSRRHKL